MKVVDIGDEIGRVCAKFGLDKTDVNHIEFWPSEVTFSVLLRNESGAKYINDDGEVAVELHTHKVKT